MRISLLLLLGLLPAQQDARELQQRLQQLQQELQQSKQELQQSQAELSQVRDQLAQVRREPKSTCAADLRLVRGTTEYTVPAGQTAAVPINLLSTVSQAREPCLPAVIRVSASYIGANDNLICSGHIVRVAGQDQPTQNVNLLIRPWNRRELVFWTNEPPGGTALAKPLQCVTPDGLNEVEVDGVEGVAVLKIQLTTLPTGGGLSSIELRFNRPGFASR